MTGFPSLRVRIARHAMEGRALAGELRSFVTTEEMRGEALLTRALALAAADKGGDAEAVNDHADALEERLEALRSLRDAVNEAAGSVTDGVADLDACGEERTPDAPRH